MACPPECTWNLLHRDLLLALAAVAIERVEQHGIGARKLVGLTQVLATPLERLFADHGAPVALHGGVVRGEELSRDHPFKLVCRPDPDQAGEGRTVLPIAGLL